MAAGVDGSRGGGLDHLLLSFICRENKYIILNLDAYIEIIFLPYFSLSSLSSLFFSLSFFLPLFRNENILQTLYLISKN